MSSNQALCIFDLDLLAVFGDHCCNVPTIGNRCAKFEHLPAKMERYFDV